MKVINDLAERGVALIEKFNASITRNDETETISPPGHRKSSKSFLSSNQGCNCDGKKGKDSVTV